MPVGDEQAILREQQAFSRAWNQGDVEALADFFTEDAVRVGAFGDIQHGRAEIAAGFHRLLRERMPGARVQLERGTVRMLSPELAVWQGGIQITLPAGPPRKGYVVEVLRKVGDRWLVLESHPKLFPESL